MDLNLMDWKDPETIKEQSIHIIIILHANYKKADLEQEVNKVIQLTKFQRVILLSCLKHYKNIFDVNLGEWTVPQVDIPLKDGAKYYHVRTVPIAFIHLEDFKKYLDRLVVIGLLTKN